MSRASAGATPTLGMAVSESTAFGSSIQRTMFSGALGSTPAMYERCATPVSGGPTSPLAPITPEIV